MGADMFKSSKPDGQRGEDRRVKLFEYNEEETDGNGFLFSGGGNGIFYIPEEVLSLILSMVDGDTLMHRCRFVCRSWRRIVDTLAFRQKAERELKGSPIEGAVDKRRGIHSWYIYRFLLNNRPLFGRNLLKNGCGQEGLRHWRVLDSGGDGWRVETIPAGADTLPQSKDFEGLTSCFATSFFMCSKAQTIKLSDTGLNSIIMDELQPVITVSEWYAGRFDCACEYEMRCALFTEDKKMVTDFKELKRVEQWQGHAWNRVVHTFQSYGPGVRYIAFQHAGKDSQFWKGHYGSKMAGASITLHIPPPP